MTESTAHVSNRKPTQHASHVHLQPQCHACCFMLHCNFNADTTGFGYADMLGCQCACSVWDSFYTHQCFFHCRIISLQSRLGMSWLACMLHLHHLQLYLTACMETECIGVTGTLRQAQVAHARALFGLQDTGACLNCDCKFGHTVALVQCLDLTECQANTFARRHGLTIAPMAA